MSLRRLKTFGRTELTNDGGGVLVLRVDGIVEAADIAGRKFAGEISEGGAELGKSGERRLPNDRHGVVWREIVPVVDEGDEAKSVDEPVGRVAGDDVYLMIDEGTVDKSEVHDFGRFCEMQAVVLGEARKSVGAFEEFVADAGAPLGSE